MTWLYSAAILLGSCLLFLVQPMCAKMLLPLMGGTPAVWTTCMVFFQAGLLAGYAYAHWLPQRLGIARHAMLHILLLIATYFLLPIHMPEEVPEGWHPVLWLLVSLTLAVGAPFVLLAAGAPLVQRWFVHREQAGPRDPYFLYAASNLGSFIGLALFPLVFESYWSLPQQNEMWQLAFAFWMALLAFCAPVRSAISTQPAPVADAAPSGSTRARWIVLAMIPSSLLLSVTTHLTTDVASIPLLWLIPMSIYLLTFVIVFAQRQWISHAMVVRWLPLSVLALLIVLLSEAVDPLPLVMGVHLACFFWMALACHGELSRTRPAAGRLTDFYLCLSLGGVLGGVLNALMAPVIFNGLLEYPLMIVLAAYLGLRPATWPTRRDTLVALGLGIATAAVILIVQWRPVVRLTCIEAGPTSVAAIFGVPLIVCYLMKDMPARFAMSLGAILLASGLYHGIHGAAAYRERSFFGIHRVTVKDGFRQLFHGNTVHGQQSLDSERRLYPLTYYSPPGPIGDVFRIYKGDARLEKVGAVGLGTGSVAAYSKAGQSWTFFELDPSVKRIAEDPSLFTFLSDAQADIRVELGDARLQLEKSKETFGLLIVDAFGSDAIPVHLLTREALRIYLRRLEPNGLIAFHISNRYVDLEPVLALLAKDADCDALIKRHHPERDQEQSGIMASHWLVLTRTGEDAKLLRAERWSEAKARPGVRLWTDQSSNLLQVFRWRGDE